MKSYGFYLSMLLWLIQSPLLAQRVAFCPDGDGSVNSCEVFVVDFINDSQRNLDVAIYLLSSNAIVGALKSAHDRGVVIRILFDDQQIQSAPYSTKFSEIQAYGIDVRRYANVRWQHNKFAIRDESTVLTGSYNWKEYTDFSTMGSNNALILIDTSTINSYKENFETLWNEGF